MAKRIAVVVAVVVVPSGLSVLGIDSMAWIGFPLTRSYGGKGLCLVNITWFQGVGQYLEI